jgi:hypothetical protein
MKLAERVGHKVSTLSYSAYSNMSYDFQCNSFDVLNTKVKINGGKEVLVLRGGGGVVVKERTNSACSLQLFDLYVLLFRSALVT